jgi:hypothetical protein
VLRVEHDVVRIEDVPQNFLRPEAGMDDELAGLVRDLGQRSRGIGHASNAGRVARRADDHHVVLRPRLRVHRVTIGDEVDGDVAGVHRDQVDAALLEDGRDAVFRPTGARLDVDAALALEALGERVPEADVVHSANDRDAHDPLRRRRLGRGCRGGNAGHEGEEQRDADG